jgi:hypothetical protein
MTEEKKHIPSPELDRLLLPPNERGLAKPSEDVRVKGYDEQPANLFRAPWLRGSEKKEE